MKTLSPLLGLVALFALLAAATAGPSLSLVKTGEEEVAPLGPIHVAGPGPHAIPIAVRGVPGATFSLKGELFRRLSATVAPVAVFDWKKEAAIPSSGELIVRPEFSFEASKTSTSYLARFHQPGFPALAIIAHPADFLEPLQTLAQGRPLQLAGASDDLRRVLQDAGVRTEAVCSDAVSFEEKSIILWCSEPGPAFAPPKESRLIITDLLEPGREVWKRSAEGGWVIHLHPSALTSTRLATTTGLAHLLELTTREPIP
ncbi:hypothetical protein [Luteolibacter soli]|uniref:Uncharacterized protein n=1 Tax=Luteolibacter soli TaxID=3135280 RepID=A0ABU9B2I3_9BACT